MKKLFISQPMNGKTKEEILIERNFAIETAKKILGEGEIEVLNTVYDDFNPDAKPLEYLARSIKDLSTADIVFIGRGFENARGCLIEYDCAVKYGYPTVLYNGTKINF